MSPTTTRRSGKYFAIRQCQALNGPAIFFDWDDCNFYVEQCEFDNVDFQEFESIVEAVKYVSYFHRANDVDAKDDGGTAVPTVATVAAPTAPTVATVAVAPKQVADALVSPGRTANSSNNKKRKEKTLASSMNSKPRKSQSRSPKRPRKSGEEKAATKKKKETATEARELLLLHMKEKFDDQFDGYFTKLKAYKEEFGHVNSTVRKNNYYGDLGVWIRLLQTEIRKYQQDPSSSVMDEPRVKAVMDLGLDLDRQASGEYQVFDWDEVFEQLCKFQRENGHPRVPDISDQPRLRRLRRWVLLQRSMYEELKAGKTTGMTPAKIAKLGSIGFRFEANKRRTFDERAVEWLEYYTKHGKDPSGEAVRGLVHWVLQTRDRYYDYVEGKNSGLTPQKIGKLSGWGFKWGTRDKSRKVKMLGRKGWDERYAELLEYKQIHGNCDVPQKCRPLGSWVHRQRRSYIDFHQGQKTFIDKDKIKKLNDVGFTWKTRERSQNKKRKMTSSDDSSSEDENDDLSSVSVHPLLT